MRYIEPHGHMVSRTTDDYQAMVAAGCSRRVRTRVLGRLRPQLRDGFRDYFRQLTEYEPARAAKFLLPHYCWLCSTPRSPRTSPSPRGARDDPGVSRKPNVLGIGEIGLNRNTRNELKVLEQHIDLAVKHDQLILVHTPHLEDKLKGTRLIVDVLRSHSGRQARPRHHRPRRGAHHPSCSIAASGPASRCIRIPNRRRRARSTCWRSAAANASGSTRPATGA
jgi:predicted metal-dependent TIM-barrel fold hydrolase